MCAGGTLYQDIKTTQTYNHSDFKSRAFTTHPVFIEKNSKLYHILGADTVYINSMHHQAVNQVGEGLVVTARSTDGFIEGLALEGPPFCLVFSQQYALSVGIPTGMIYCWLTKK